MKLRSQAWSVVSVATGGLLAVVLLVGGLLFNHGYRTLEETDASREVARALAVISVETDDLERTTRDYAEWMDTVAFVQGRLPSYQEDNWTASALANVRVDFSLAFAAGGQPVQGAELNHLGESVEPAGAARFNVFSAEVARVLADRTSHTRVRGIKEIDGALVMFSCTPVLPVRDAREPQGALVNGRWIDDAFMVRLQQTIGRPVRIHMYAGEPVGERRERFTATAIEDVSVAIPARDQIIARALLRGSEGEPRAWLQLDLNRPFRRQAVWTLWMFAGVVVASGLLFGGITQWLLRTLVITRLEALHRGLGRVRSANDLSVRLPVTGSDEIAGLGRALNTMLEALERGRRERERAQQERESLQGQLVRAQKMEVMGEIARGIAHDFNNCLTVIGGWIGVVRESLPEKDENHELLGHALTSTAHAVDVVKQLLLYSRQSNPAREPVRLGPMLNHSFKLLRSAVPKEIALELHTSTVDDCVLGDRTPLIQVLVNLVKNAADAINGAGRITISLNEVQLPDPTCVGSAGLAAGAYLRLSVQDNGPGIPEEVRDQIFEPFFTTKAMGRGTGLGLAVVSSVVSRHAGGVGVESGLGQGTTFHVYLPRHTTDKPSEQITDVAAPALNGLRILVAEDDSQVAQVVAAIIRRHGGDVLVRPDGLAAWQAFKAAEPPFDLVLTDFNMPRLNGVQLGERIFESARRVPVVLMSAYAATLDSERLLKVGFAAVVGKPLMLHDLLVTLSAARQRAMNRGGNGPGSLL